MDTYICVVDVIWPLSLPSRASGPKLGLGNHHVPFLGPLTGPLQPLAPSSEPWRIDSKNITHRKLIVNRL